MPRVIDLECNLPAGEEYPEYHEEQQVRPGNPVAGRLERPEGYGFDNYKRIFQNRERQYQPRPEAHPGERMEAFIAEMDRAGVGMRRRRRLQQDPRAGLPGHTRTGSSVLRRSARWMACAACASWSGW